MSKTILLTGIAGFIGHETALALLARGDAVIGVDNFNDYYDPALKRARVERLKGAAAVYECDVTDKERLGEIIRKHRPNQICHLAAQAGVGYSLKNPFAYEMANNLGTLTIFELARHNGIPSVIYASSSSVYGGNTKIPFSTEDPVDKPISIYAATKRYNELLAHTYHHLYGIRSSGLRFFTVYGPWGRPDMSLYKFTEAIAAGKPIDVYNHGKMKRDFTFISDIVAGVLASLDKDYPYEIFNLGNSNTVDLLTFIATIEKELGKPAKKNMLDMQPGDVPETFADIAKSRRLLGFDPKVKIDEGIRRFVAWYKDYHGVR